MLGLVEKAAEHGDMAIWLPQMRLHNLGRRQQQRHRIELGHLALVLVLQQHDRLAVTAVASELADLLREVDGIARRSDVEYHASVITATRRVPRLPIEHAGFLSYRVPGRSSRRRSRAARRPRRRERPAGPASTATGSVGTSRI